MLPIAGFAQQAMVDSLEKALKLPAPDSSRLKTLGNLCSAYASVNPQKKYQYALKYYALANQLGNTEAISDAYNHIGIYYGIKGKSDSALHYFNLAYRQAERYQHLRAMGRSLTNTGYAYDRMDNYRESIKCYYKALGIFKKINYQKGINQCSINLGSIYYDLKQYKLAESYFAQCYQNALNNNDEAGIANGLFTLGNCYTKLHKYEKAHLYFDKSLAIRRRMGDTNGEALVLKGIGVLYLEQGKYQLAIAPLEQSNKMAAKREDQYEQVAILDNLADAYIGQKEFKKAEATALKALAISHNIQTDLGKSLALDKLVRVYKGTGKTEEALKYLTAYVAVKDSLLASQALKDVTLVEFGRIKSENTDLSRNVQKAQSKNVAYLAKIDLFTFLIIAITLLLVAVVALLFVQYRRNKEKQVVNLILASQKEEIVAINKELAGINSVKNKLFSIVSHDLRGPLATLQSLFLLYREGELKEEEFKNILNQLEGTIVSTGSFLDNLLEWSKNQLEGIIVKPESFDVNLYLQENIALWDAKISLKELTVVNKTVGSVNAYADPNMFNLVIRNLLSNAVKFCRPGDNIELNAESTASGILVYVKDSGPGIAESDKARLFNLEHLTSTGIDGEKGNKLGLILCRDMVLQNKGKFWVESVQGEGTTFWIELPEALNYDQTMQATYYSDLAIT